MPFLWALHIPDQVLETPWWLLGWLAAIVWATWASRGIEDEEIPRIGLFSAVFFLGTLFHLPFFSVHLLLPGVMGLFLGNRAILAILVAMLLQAGMGHGGFSTAGINTLVMGTPACISWWFVLPLIKGLKNNQTALSFTGFFLGFFPVCLAVLLHAMVLYWGGVVPLTLQILASFPLHLPVAVAEGLFLASALPFLAASGIPPFQSIEAQGTENLNISESRKSTPPKSLPGITFLLLLGGWASGSVLVQAAEPFHNLRIDWKILEGNRLDVEAYFERGTPFQLGELILKDANGIVVLRENRHEKGHFQVQLPANTGSLDIYVQADDHLAHAHIPEKVLGLKPLDSSQTVSPKELAHSEPGKNIEVRDLVLGVCLILSFSAFWMAWRTMAKLNRLKN